MSHTTREIAVELTPFHPSVAEEIATWARTPDETMAWCSSSVAPVASDVIAGWSAAADTQAHLLRDGERLVGYGEVWVDDEEGEVELGRIIIAPEERGRGLGRTLTRMLVAAGRTHHRAVYLRVAPGNEAAVRCYRAAGFDRVDEATEAAWNEGQPQNYVWMSAG